MLPTVTCRRLTAPAFQHRLPGQLITRLPAILCPVPLRQQVLLRNPPILPEIRESRTEEKAAASRDARLFPPLLIRRFLRQVFCSRRPFFPPLFFVPSASGLLSFTLCLFSLPAVAAVFCPFSSLNFCPIASMPVAFGLRLLSFSAYALFFSPFGRRSAFCPFGPPSSLHSSGRYLCRYPLRSPRHNPRSHLSRGRQNLLSRAPGSLHFSAAPQKP